MLDQHNAGTTGAFMGANTAMAATAESARKGYLSGRSLAGVFAWLRPNDLIWNYWVSNYLMGKTPPAFDILFWNADATNLPAALHRDFLDLALDNALTEPGAATVLGTPVDLSKITVDTYVVAGIADHITPWQNAYRTVNLLGSEPRFVLSTSGHIAALVNPPGNEKATLPRQRRAARGARGVAREREHDARHVVGRLGRRGWASAPARRRPPARRSAARATSRSATRRAATCSSRRAARPRQRRPAALRAHREPASRCC